MCFVEFIGYTCGHTSFPVLRPCPLTTASHTFPTCPRRADKPFLAGEMCSACQKIIHSRATQIEEFEHRFMHERGVCGCDTVFPYLIRPRIIGGGGGSPDDDAPTDPGAPPPIIQEATDALGRAVVSVRLPSLYAAEWVADHRRRHDAGLCQCRIDFGTYSAARRAEEEEDKTEHRPRPLHHPDATRRRPRTASPTTGALPSPFGHFPRSQSEPFSSADGLDAETTATANQTVQTLTSQRTVGRPARLAGAVFAEVPAYLPLTGPFFVQATSSSSGDGPVLDGILVEEAADGETTASPSSTLVSRPDRVPLVGFPLGAGPEGVLHAVPWPDRPPCWGSEGPGETEETKQDNS